MISIDSKTQKLIIALDSWQIKSFLTCPRMWYWEYYENLRLPLLIKPKISYKDRGSLVHLLCDSYYTMRALDPDYDKDLHATASIEFVKNSPIYKSFFKDDADFIIKRFCDYLFQYRDNDLVAVKFNGQVGVEIGFSKILYEDEYRIYIVEGRIDLINYFGTVATGVLAWTDHKTQDRRENLYPYKPQFKTYAWATGLEYGIINYIGMQAKLEKDMIRREIIHFPKSMIQEWENEMLKVFEKIEKIIKVMDVDEFLYENFKKNLASCGGAFEKTPCMFRHLDETYNHDMMMSIKKFKYEKVEDWVPWKVK